MILYSRVFYVQGWKESLQSQVTQLQWIDFTRLLCRYTWFDFTSSIYISSWFKSFFFFFLHYLITILYSILFAFQQIEESLISMFFTEEVYFLGGIHLHCYSNSLREFSRSTMTKVKAVLNMKCLLLRNSFWCSIYPDGKLCVTKQKSILLTVVMALTFVLMSRFVISTTSSAFWPSELPTLPIMRSRSIFYTVLISIFEDKMLRF